MQRFGMMIRLQAGSEISAAPCCRVAESSREDQFRECNIEDDSIHFKDNILFRYFAYRGNEARSNGGKMASDPKPPTRNEGECWATMEEVFHLD